ncbi:BspA family leucine-rich repeat surface protein [Nocardioides bizhenqiangii]|uniref:BspA family leucine-rich repeat surface protein n=1 Tax=Nocardioides bizhenqiangii TaxID=3095076 RepID=A0ABZ0ZQ77_9ACTN|nr:MULTISPECIES: BspA family leucine-rich repeat surface protein [unclassified Nocardioides]MDZ5619484.1 BspA family leucine-rich repeat surface protein [Nocardioides sp. HM23]WQQ26499.1 BspA family leucine-rich repeat surface protein [Nocardioides sp. HM61]
MGDRISGTAVRAAVLALLAGLLLAAPPTGVARAADPDPRFVTTWQGTEAVLHLYGDVDVSIDWGDGTTRTVSGVRDAVDDGPITHTFTDSASTHQVEVTGTFRRLGALDYRDFRDPPVGLLSVDEWGPTDTRTAAQAFRGAKNLGAVAEPPPTVRNMFGMFQESGFNQPIGDWDVSQVTDMSYMFSETPFNQPIGDWDVSQVTDLSWMFFRSDFNQPIGGWDVSNVTSLYATFWNSPFNQPIGRWDVSNVTDMTFTFADTPFNRALRAWDVSSVESMNRTFYGAAFNRPIGSWDVSNVTDIAVMFANSRFNQPIGSWDVSSVEFMVFTFSGARRFNQPLGDWDVSNVTDMDFMFSGARSFNQDLSDWCVTDVPRPEDFDEGATAWTEPRPIWTTCAGVDSTPPVVRFADLTGTGKLRMRAFARDNIGVDAVLVSVQDQATDRWLQGNGTWGSSFARLPANVVSPGEVRTGAWFRRLVPAGRYLVGLVAVDTSGNRSTVPRPWQVVEVTP